MINTNSTNNTNNTNNFKKETNVIIFNDGSRKWTTKEVAKNITESSITNEQKHIILDGQLIRFSSIAKLLTLEEYYLQYPKEEQGPTLTNYSLLKEPYVSIEKRAEAGQESSKNLLSGLKKFIDKEQKNSNTPNNAIALYKNKLDKYKSVYGKTEETMANKQL